MKTLILIGILLISTTTFSQGQNDIVGKWKIISVDAGIYHNYKNDSTHIPKDLQESLRGSADSAFTIGFIMGMITSFDNYHYTFQPDGKFHETKNGRMQQEGTYTMDSKEKQIILIPKDKSNTETGQKFLYQLRHNILEFKVVSEDMDMKFELEKVL